MWICTYCIALNFCGSLISQIFNCSGKMFECKFGVFDMRHTDCEIIDGQYPEAKLLNLQRALSKEIPLK